MENPATWGPVEHAIRDGLEQAEQARRAGLMGLSNVRMIADMLRKRGLISDEGSADF